MKFFTTLASASTTAVDGAAAAAASASAVTGRTLGQLMTQHSLSPKLQQLVMHAIAFSQADTAAEAALKRLMLYRNSIGV